MRYEIELGEPDPDSWTSQYYPPPSIHGTRARVRASEMLAAQAPLTARAMIKNRARMYALRPRDLESIAEGLFALQPRDLVRSLRILIGIMRMSPQRLLGFGGEVMAINLRGAMLYARWSRRVAYRASRVAA